MIDDNFVLLRRGEHNRDEWAENSPINTRSYLQQGAAEPQPEATIRSDTPTRRDRDISERLRIHSPSSEPPFIGEILSNGRTKAR